MRARARGCRACSRGVGSRISEPLDRVTERDRANLSPCRETIASAPSRLPQSARRFARRRRRRRTSVATTTPPADSAFDLPRRPRQSGAGGVRQDGEAARSPGPSNSPGTGTRRITARRDPPTTTATTAHLAFEVDDIYAACARLMAGGVTIARPPRDGRMAFVRSPDLGLGGTAAGGRGAGPGRAVGVDAEHRGLVRPTVRKRTVTTTAPVHTGAGLRSGLAGGRISGGGAGGPAHGRGLARHAVEQPVDAPGLRADLVAFRQESARISDCRPKIARRGDRLDRLYRCRGCRRSARSARTVS